MEHRVRNWGVRGQRTEDRDSSVGAAFQPRRQYANGFNYLPLTAYHLLFFELKNVLVELSVYILPSQILNFLAFFSQP